jgi:hypothetical protein
MLASIPFLSTQTLLYVSVRPTVLLDHQVVTRIKGTEEETSVYILCECEALASRRHQYLGSFFLDPEDIRVLVVGAIWNFIKGTGLL